VVDTNRYIYFFFWLYEHINFFLLFIYLIRHRAIRNTTQLKTRYWDEPIPSQIKNVLRVHLGIIFYFFFIIVHNIIIQLQ